MLNIFIFVSVFVVFFSRYTHSAADWDPFIDIEKDHQKTENPNIPDTQKQKEDWPQDDVRWQEDKNGYTLTMPLTGVDQHSLQVKAREGNVMVSASSSQDTQKHLNLGGNTLDKQELEQNTFHKTVRLPEDADTNFMTTHYADGILNIVIPKKKLKSII